MRGTWGQERHEMREYVTFDSEYGVHVYGCGETQRYITSEASTAVGLTLVWLASIMRAKLLQGTGRGVLISARSEVWYA